ILKKGVDAWNAWRRENPDIRPDLSRAGLSGAVLSEADLSKPLTELLPPDPNLTELFLRPDQLNEPSDIDEGRPRWSALTDKIKLPHSGSVKWLTSGEMVVRRADPPGGVNLVSADLSRADLGGAVLVNANLSGADLTGAELFLADLSSANLCR